MLAVSGCNAKQWPQDVNACQVHSFFYSQWFTVGLGQLPTNRPEQSTYS